MVSATMKFNPDFCSISRPCSTLVPSSRNTIGSLMLVFFAACDHAIGQRIHAQDAAENIDQHRLHVLIAEQDFERMGDLLSVRAAAHVEKVRRHAASVFDDVHGRHRQAGAIHHAADVAIQLDVVQAVL